MSSSVKTDPELTQQLDNTSGGESLVEAVVRLRPDDPDQIVPSPERTEELTQKVLERVKKQVGKSEARYNVFRNLGSFAVAAEPEFLRELISQPEIVTAIANRQSQSAMIEPVKKRPVPERKQKAPRSAKGSKTRAAAARSAKAHKAAK
ncbi:MAG TPA: hypothetical protein VGN90_10160 [Pyrinomonadaceae bacterium]|jgi:hypothetical protein|nr:hypothetical protein [Pyrinomonadaceae bacterium]